MADTIRGKVIQGGLYGLLVVLIPILLFIGDARWQDKAAAAQIHSDSAAAGAASVLANERAHAAILTLLAQELGVIKVTLARQDATMQAILRELRRSDSRTAASRAPR